MSMAELNFERKEENYTATLVTYIDILGFGEKVENNNCDEIYEILKNFYKVTGEDDNLKKLIDLNVITFSDTSLRLYQIKKLPFGLLLFEIINMGMIQCHLLFQDTLIRGCIHAGAFFSSGNTFYGPALIAAYNLESKSVTYPMIALSPKISKILEEKETYFDEHDMLVKNDHKDISELIFRENGLHYINYLKVMLGMVEKSSTKGIILKHRELINKNLENYASYPKIFNKYKWLENYHNTFLKNNLKPGFNQELYI
jgi:hypothetical protein